MPIFMGCLFLQYGHILYQHGGNSFLIPLNRYSAQCLDTYASFMLFLLFRGIIASIDVLVLTEAVLTYLLLRAALPQLPDAVSQNHSQDTVNRTTVINWQPATVDSASNNVTYIVTNGSDLIMDFDNTTATATVALPAFNTDYSFCVDAVNVCGLYSGKPKCATPPVRIGAEGTLHHCMSKVTTSSRFYVHKDFFLCFSGRN